MPPAVLCITESIKYPPAKICGVSSLKGLQRRVIHVNFRSVAHSTLNLSNITVLSYDYPRVAFFFMHTWGHKRGITEAESKTQIEFKVILERGLFPPYRNKIQTPESSATIGV